MNIIYRVTYIPHLENGTPPYYYIGSKMNYREGAYFGSLSSKQQTWYSEGMSVQAWWKTRKKDDFKFEILRTLPDDISAKEIVQIEKQFHDSLNVLSDLFFNFSKATLGFVSCKKSNETRQKISAKTREFWNSSAGQNKRVALCERNRNSKPHEMKKKWRDPEFVEKMKSRSGPNHTSISKNSISNAKKKFWETHKNTIVKKVKIGDKIFSSAIEAAKAFQINAVNVRRKCRLAKFTEWNYID